MENSCILSLNANEIFFFFGFFEKYKTGPKALIGKGNFIKQVREIKAPRYTEQNK